MSVKEQADIIEALLGAVFYPAHHADTDQQGAMDRAWHTFQQVVVGLDRAAVTMDLAVRAAAPRLVKVLMAWPSGATRAHLDSTPCRVDLVVNKVGTLSAHDSALADTHRRTRLRTVGLEDALDEVECCGAHAYRAPRMPAQHGPREGDEAAVD